MSWYYAKNNTQSGPIDHSELDRLVRQGEISADTLVWREGMANWTAYGELTAAASSAPPPVISPGEVRCVECGRTFPSDEVILLEPGYVCGDCKSVVLQKMGEGVMPSGAEQIRRDHLKHEASVKSVGVLYLLGGMIGVVAGIAGISAGRAESMIMGLLLVVWGAGQFTVALGVRRLRAWARIPAAIFAGIGLLGFPLGTIISSYILYLLLCQKGRTVFSPGYQQVMAQTPHIKYRTSIIVWIVLALLVALIAFMVLAAFVGRR